MTPPIDAMAGVINSHSAAGLARAEAAAPGVSPAAGWGLSLGHLAEFGIIAAQGSGGVKAIIQALHAERDNSPELARGSRRQSPSSSVNPILRVTW
jgi:hypothetical protein